MNRDLGAQSGDSVSYNTADYQYGLRRYSLGR